MLTLRALSRYVHVNTSAEPPDVCGCGPETPMITGDTSVYSRPPEYCSTGAPVPNASACTPTRTNAELTSVYSTMRESVNTDTALTSKAVHGAGSGAGSPGDAGWYCTTTAMDVDASKSLLPRFWPATCTLRTRLMSTPCAQHQQHTVRGLDAANRGELHFGRDTKR
jgi:hypothetical protein